MRTQPIPAAYNVLKVRNARRRAETDRWSVAWGPCSEWQRRQGRVADHGYSG